MSDRETRFERLRLPEIEEEARRGSTILIPIGAIEQHGPHLPIETDTFAATTFALECARAFDDVLVAPAVPWGLSNSHIDIGATLTVRPSTLIELGMDLTESFVRMGFGKLVWVNGHLGNRPFLGLAVYESKRRFGLSVAALTYFELGTARFNEVRASPMGGTGHACEFETSLLLHLAPDSVARYEAESAAFEPFTEWDFSDLTSPGAAAIGYTFGERFPTGVAGDPSVATAETGAAIHDACLEALIEFVRQYKQTPLVERSAEAGTAGGVRP